MGQTIHLDKPVGVLADVARVAFPDYTGRKFRLQATESLDVRSYWDGGSRDYFVFVRLADLKTGAVPAQSAFDRQIRGADAAPVPPGFVCVEHSIFCGKDHGLTFHVNPADLTPMLPAPVTLTWAEQVVLYAARSLKSSYGGIPNFRRTQAIGETKITGAEYDAAKSSLIDRRMLNGAGAITTDGRNALGDSYSWPKKGA